MSDVRESKKEVVKTEDVIGVDVRNAEDENLGSVEEIMLDKHEGIVRYVVLSFGGFLGIGDKLYALPWKALNYNREKDCFIVNISKEQLKNAPGFHKDNWPDMSDMTWGQTVYDFYDIEPYWKKTMRD